jgi:eukaryotic-like serine/threonine-protein kinase
MGEVYRARDTKLEWDVAIKVLPAALAQDPERLARFERDAKVLAALITRTSRRSTVSKNARW